METKKQIQGGGRITLPILINIANPGAIILSALAPAIIGVVLAYERVGRLPVFFTIIVVMIPLLFNASIDLLNDYYDFVRGNDTSENIVDEADAPLAYNNITDVKPVLWAGLGCLFIGVLLGIYVVLQTGAVPLIIGCIGAITVLTYSAGKLPLSYLPIGEIVAGFVMGGLIPLGVFSALTGTIDYWVLYKSIPMMLIVAHFMLVNNTCDIERDEQVGRRTLPILIGREKAKKLCTLMTAVWVIQMLHVVLAWYPLGTPAIIIMLLLFGKAFIGMCKGERTTDTKLKDVGHVAGAAFGVAIFLPIAFLIQIFFG